MDAERASLPSCPRSRQQGASCLDRPTLPSLTGLRWVAALLVFGLHASLAQYVGGTGGAVVSRVCAAGDTGVCFFFMLSGFVLTWSYHRGDGAVLFLWHRAARIYPVYLTTTALAGVLAYTITPYMKPHRTALIADLLLAQTWDPAWRKSLNPVSWSLACEAFFYCMFPLLIRLIQRFPARMAGAACLAVITIAACFSHGTTLGWTWDAYYNPLARLPEFISGILLARLVALNRQRGPSLPWVCPVTLLCYGGACMTGGAWHNTLMLPCFAFLIPAAAQADINKNGSWWGRPVMVRLGKISFCFYMIHLLMIRLVERIFDLYRPQLPSEQGTALVLGVFSASLILAWLLHTGIEQPAQRFMLRLRHS
ncbi:acyltransferase [Streptomyces sp. NPDC001817]|uniref:acyltransferase family protein n=1 Tax=Streptomyces sp. NPDC001817 TaxID=3154398 RepID=UPI003322CD87